MHIVEHLLSVYTGAARGRHAAGNRENVRSSAAQLQHWAPALVLEETALEHNLYYMN